MRNETILDVSNLSLSFKLYGKAFEKHKLKVINSLNVSIFAGEILAVVGSSGSGKSLLAHAVLGILPRNAMLEGEVVYKGERLTIARAKKLRGNEIALVPQSVAYLDPLMKVGRQLSSNKATARKALTRYGLDESVGELFPFQLSGGMVRRVLCATAAISGAKLIIADEPTPGMSKELASKVMRHFRALADEGAAVMLITHDIDLALGYSDRIAVFYAGTTVETAFASDFSSEHLLRHPYTKALWRAMPQNGFAPTLGMQPFVGSILEGCLFAPRCGRKTEACTKGIIEQRTVREGAVCCLYAD